MPSPAKKRRVLIADDHEDCAVSLKLLMEAIGYEALSVRNGEDAIRASLTFLPDVVVLDIGMPRFSGYDAARLIRLANPARKHMIVAVSGWGRPEDKALSLKAGMNAHFSKPIDFPKFLEQVEGFFNS